MASATTLLLFGWVGIGLLSLTPVGVARAAQNAEPATAPLSSLQVFENLKSNARVEWLVRMVAYDAADPQLEVHHLTSLGGPREDFTFVADHAELRGCTVADAVYKAGGSLKPGQRVSCILFPVGRNTIYPASVRGMLQVVQQIDMRRASESGYRAAPLDVLLTDRERANLAVFSLDSWAWDNYREHFPAFAAAVSTLRERKASAFDRIGYIGHDWSEAGCARWLRPTPAADANTMTLELADGQPFVIKNLGVRVFLIRNQSIADLPGRVLVDIEDPERQTMPELPAGAASAK